MSPVAIRKVLVAIDASGPSLAALEAAARVAARSRAVLEGLFVEDMNLVRAATIPVSRQVGSHSAEERALDAFTLEREFRTQAEQARLALASLASRLDLSWSFRIARGRVEEAVLEASAEADLLACALAGHPALRMGSTARTLAARAAHPVLFVRVGPAPRRVVFLACDGTVDPAPAAEAAACLCGEEEPDLRLLCAARTPAEARAVEERIAPRISAIPRADVRRFRIAEEVGALIRASAGEPGGVLVIDRRSAMVRGDGLERLLRESAGSVLVV